MAKLSDKEKEQFLAASERKASTQPPMRRLSPREFVEFATFASRFSRPEKSVRFGGANWKL
jgi:hypothetical protein